MKPHRLAAAVCALQALLLLGACGGGSTGGTGSSGGGLSDSTKSYLKGQIDKYSSQPSFTAPGPAVNIAAAKGKKVFAIPFSSSNPFCAAMDAAGKAAAESAGLQWQEWENQGTSSSWVQGMNTAIAEKVAAINLTCGLGPAQLGPQLEAADSAHIPVIIGYAYDPSQPVPAHVAGRVDGSFSLPGQLQADWAILKSNGNADVLVIQDNEFPPAVVQITAMKNEFDKYCPKCKVKYQNVSANDWSTKIQPLVQSSISANSKLNYVLPIYDAMAQFVLPAIVATGASDRVKIATFNATPAVLDQMRTGNVIEMDLGEGAGWIGYAMTDQDLRVATGMDAIKSEVVGARMFTKDNVNEAGTPAQLTQGYGSAFVDGYKKLWGLT